MKIVFSAFENSNYKSSLFLIETKAFILIKLFLIKKKSVLYKLNKKSI